ncbi:Methyltransferase domain-containing protein [Asanoa ishikariensis]|uniref:Methyltransferase domain-containing protein n=1 Tax=Asanoa ishikariensis TaxID=137265 RepID=A0A1H3TQP9_9ACTN|nr:class I SAM-dependent methyltransferase [Asanoa ishikariensis]SDZ51659.1 Methyltransferase domain-containing protein [Asanoa ishikariensis]
MSNHGAQFWDDLYGSRDQVFSGRPNGVLVTEVTDLPPGRALDVGCGEGADARWLAQRGWQVTAIDISRTALDRAATTDPDLADRVTWTALDLTQTPPPGEFDLVTAQYFPLLKQAGDAGPRGLVAAVAPGGTLLVASHDPADLPPGTDHGFDPADYWHPADIAALLGDDWTILANESRPRTTPAPPGTHHQNDTVLLACRR